VVSTSVFPFGESILLDTTDGDDNASDKVGEVIKLPVESIREAVLSLSLPVSPHAIQYHTLSLLGLVYYYVAVH
jgi:hypothetical protein